VTLDVVAWSGRANFSPVTMISSAGRACTLVMGHRIKAPIPSILVVLMAILPACAPPPSQRAALLATIYPFSSEWLLLLFAGVIH
jgi:hypothetical protein